MTGAVREILAEQQRARAADGRQGVQTTGMATNPLGPQSLSGRASPALHRPDGISTYTREGIGPNGERWSMTVNETNLTFSQNLPNHHPLHQPGQPVNQHPALDQLQNILRNADRFLPAQTLPNGANNMERAGSNPLPAPSVPTSAIPGSHIGTATPATTHDFPTSSAAVNVSHGEMPAVLMTSHAIHAPIVGQANPMVYLLSSQNGPRALLLNNSETFYTSRAPSRRRRQDESHVVPDAPQNNIPIAAGLPEFRNRLRGARRGNRHLQPQNNALEPANVAGPHANPGALAAQIGPMIWLIARLIGFVWFFTAGNPSWSRWFMFSGLALVVFVINTGIFNGLFEQLWGPIRRHVEVLIPLAGPEAAQVPAINAAIPRVPPVDDAPAEPGQEPIAQRQGQRRGEPDPAQVASFLIEQHRQRNAPSWLMLQIRRAEHAMLLFLASLVPGVGERHIAAREAEANAVEAERQRRVDAAVAAATAATAATAENLNSEAENGELTYATASDELVAGDGSSSSKAPPEKNEESQATGPATASQTTD